MGRDVGRLKFGKRAVREAAGTILAHSLRLPDRILKKGRLLAHTDISEIEAAGVRFVVVASPESDDIGEDQAVALLAVAIAGAHIECADPFTGRCNMRAQASGLLILNQDGVDRINGVHESLTVATLPPYSVVTQKQLIATVKAIPFAVPRGHIDACIEAAKKHAPTICIAPFNEKSVGFIQTRLSGTKESVLNKTTDVLRRRLRRLNSDISRELRCPHDEEAVMTAITELIEAGADMIVVAGASAVVDRKDVIPAAIERSGGRIIHFGMPVDPGNLLLMARHGKRPVLGMPGCARSPKFNGFDIVLERLAADIPVTARDIMLMGTGGLLQEIVDRPQPRTGLAGEAVQIPGDQHRIAAIVLAAGKSRRMGETNKLLMNFDGQPMLAHVGAALGASHVKEIIVITGHDKEQVEAIFAGSDARCMHNPNYAAGLSTSLATGLNALSDDIDAALICLGDMPRVTAGDIDRLIDAFDPDAGRMICVPVYEGKRGNPVLWPRPFFTEMSELHGDVGAKHLLFDYEDLVLEVEMPDSGVLLDFDTEQALADHATESTSKDVG